MNKPIPPQLELEQAKRTVEAMRQANSLVQFEQAWKGYLHHIERVWYKTDSYFNKEAIWRSRKKQVERQRNNDPLLLYLTVARGADEHTIEEIVDKKPGYIAINPVEPGGMLHIDLLEIKGPKMTIQSVHPFRLESQSPHLVLRPIRRREKVVTVPMAHLGSAIDQNDIVGIAQKGINFYEKVLIEMNAHEGSKENA